MPGLTIHRLTDPWALPMQLSAALRQAEPALDPLAVVQVVVPAMVWRGWLARALADATGVLAGVELLDLPGWRRQLPSVAPGSLALRTLAMYQALPQAAAADADLADWLARDPDGSWRMALAQQLAQGMAEDLVQRPMLGVDDPGAPPWWRALVAALAALPTPAALDAGMPAALHWISSLPPLAHDWAVLSGLARGLPVTVWLLTPAEADFGAALRAQLGAAWPPLPAPLAAALRPLPLPTLSHPLAAQPRSAAALRVGSAASLQAQLRLAEAWLRERFAADPELSPAEVLLLSPAWPEAIPLIDALFGAASGPAWPYRIAGRRPPPSTPSLFDALLRSPERRWTAQELLGLLRQPALMAGLALDPAAAARLQAQLADWPGGWGLDADSRRDWEAGSDPTHTWQTLWPLLAAGLDAADPLRHALPRLHAALIAYRAASRAAQSVAAQSAACAALLAALLPPARQHPAADAVWLAWQGVCAELAGSAELRLPQAAFARLVAALLPPQLGEAARPAPDTAAVEAGLRFAPLKAGAIRPARLIVLFGLDALSFPRRAAAGPLEDWRAALDALHPALAPPTPAALDRQLLLESLWMAADATLWLYTDRDARSGQSLPAPAPIEATLALWPALPPLPALAPLPASPPASQALPARRAPRELSVAELCACFRDPARFQQERVHAVQLPPAPLPEEGALSLRPSAAWQLRAQLLQTLDRQRGAVLPDAPDAAQQASLPPGAAGLAAWQHLCTEARALWQFQQSLLLDAQTRWIEVELLTDDPPLRLGGRLPIHGEQLFERIAGAPQARHLVHAWIRALALAAMETEAKDLVLLGLGAEGPMHLVIRLPPPSEAQQHIAELLAGYHTAWTRPLAFTPALALALLDGQPRDAHWHWTGTAHTPGESSEPLNRWLWAGRDPSAPDCLPELQRYAEILLPIRLRRPWRKLWR